MIRTRTKSLGALGCGALAAVFTASSALGAAPVSIPDRPEKLTFEPLKFEPPKAADYKHTLPNGVTVFLWPSHEFPLVNVTLTFKGGAYLEPEGKAGLASMTAAMIRRGGTSSVKAEELDEQFDFLASQASSTGGGGISFAASLNSLASNFNESFGLFLDMLKNPGFQEDKVKVYRDERLEEMKQRNDDADTILRLQAQRLMWGVDHFEGRAATKTSLESITIDDMRAFHAKVYHPGNLVIGVTGDFEPQAMLKTLESALASWPAGAAIPDPVDTSHTPTPGLYYVEKDIPQGKVTIAHRGIKRDDPDAIAVSVMNDILGGGGFTARLMKRIRSDEGLTYGVFSGFRNRVYYPGEFACQVASKNVTVALASKMILEEIEKIRSAPVSDEELAVSRDGFLETFPRTFESKQGSVNIFIDDHWTKRDPNYWATYRDKLRAITKEEVQRVAQKHLDPSRLVMLVVGKWSEIAAGNPTEQRPTHQVTAKDLMGGQATRLPLLDPLTLEALPMN